MVPSKTILWEGGIHLKGQCHLKAYPPSQKVKVKVPHIIHLYNIITPYNFGTKKQYIKQE